MNKMNKRFQVIYGTDLPDKFKEAYSDDHWFLVEIVDGVIIRIVGSDGGEPEDQLLVRDWSWVADEMNKLANELDDVQDRLDKVNYWCNLATNGENEARSESEKMKAVVDAAKELRDSGYDGPFIGPVCAPLFTALAAYERSII